jgi:uncharacterized protein (DUF58 family)
MLTHVSQTFQDNVGLLVFSHQVVQWLPPAKGRGQHARFLQALYSVKPELCYVNYREAFQYLIGKHPKRALTMVFTDLLDTTVSSDYRDAARLLRQFHLPVTLAVADVPLRQLAAKTPEDTEQMYDVVVARDLLLGRAELLAGLERGRHGAGHGAGAADDRRGEPLLEPEDGGGCKRRVRLASLF